MPQSKGTATWLTNVRQDTPQERVRLDNSRAKIENKRIDCEHDQNVDSIWLKYYRSKADMKFELKRAREEADHWRRMRSQLEKNRAHTAIEARRKERVLLRQQAEEAKYAIIRPNGEVVQGNNNISEKAVKSTKPFASRTPSSTSFDEGKFGSGFRIGQGLQQRVQRPSTVSSYRTSQVSSSDDDDDDKKGDADSGEDDDVFNPYSHHPPGMKSQDRIKSGRFQGRKTRAKSTSSVRRFSRPQSHSRGSSSSEMDPHDHSSKKPGRSFQELKDLTHIDRITDNERLSIKTEKIKRRESRQAEEHEKLQRRIESFYVDVDTLKRKLTPVPKKTTKPLRMASWC